MDMDVSITIHYGHSGNYDSGILETNEPQRENRLRHCRQKSRKQFRY